MAASINHAKENRKEVCTPPLYEKQRSSSVLAAVRAAVAIGHQKPAANQHPPLEINSGEEW